MAETVSADDLHARALAAVRKANEETAAGLPGSARLRAVKDLRDQYGGTGLLSPFVDAVAAAEKEIGQETTREQVAKWLHQLVLRWNGDSNARTWDGLDGPSQAYWLSEASDLLAEMNGDSR